MPIKREEYLVQIGAGQNTIIFVNYCMYYLCCVVVVIGNVSVQVITDPCAGGEIYLNSNVTLRCSVSGSQPAIETINWFRIRNTLEPILSGVDRFTLDNDNTSLTITRITADYAAHYHCRVSNGPLMQNSQPVLLTVRSKRKITRTLKYKYPKYPSLSNTPASDLVIMSLSG